MHVFLISRYVLSVIVVICVKKIEKEINQNFFIILHEVIGFSAEST